MQVISCDVKGFVKFWDAETYGFPAATVSFSSVFATDLMACVKAGVVPKSIAISQNGKWLAITCSDLSVLVLSYRTGKLRRRLDTCLEVRSRCVNRQKDYCLICASITTVHARRVAEVGKLLACACRHASADPKQAVSRSITHTCLHTRPPTI